LIEVKYPKGQWGTFARQSWTFDNLSPNENLFWVKRNFLAFAINQTCRGFQVTHDITVAAFGIPQSNRKPLPNAPKRQRLDFHGLTIIVYEDDASPK
jgi:hypothetical protein